MQTLFTPTQLENPKLAEANKILRSCVHCGFCTATCPSYQVLGDEADSPRGRIYAIKEMLETGRPADKQTVTHIDRCLSCLACMTTCPSGVNYMHLIDQAREYVEQTYKRPLMDKMLRSVLAFILPYPARFRLALYCARMMRPLAFVMPDRRLRAMIELAPKSIPKASLSDHPQSFAPMDGPAKYRVALLTGCAQKVLDPKINDATIRILTRLGCEVVIAGGMGCCGALRHHMGKGDGAREQAAENIDAWLGVKHQGGLDAVIINTSGCGTTVKEYGHLFTGHSRAAEAAEISGLACDITEFLSKIGLTEGARKSVRVAYHAACSLQHGQKIKDAPKDLLKRVGFEVVQPKDSHLCCGSAGTYNMLQPEISGELRLRKQESLVACKADVIAAGNLGCMTQIAHDSDLRVVHTVELLDWALGGPRPEGFPASP
ncbi:MAG: glycolate oxidase subunit GlcF [Paracoccaceae bacterium]|nr:glycolate oxidase subunit GlcF [Paracoccaceae bacterium]